MDPTEKMKSYRDLIIRCPRLGDEVPFSYCEHEAGKLPCRQVIGCWEAGFPVEAYLRENLAPNTWKLFCDQIPKDRLVTLIELVEAAKQRQQSSGG